MPAIFLAPVPRVDYASRKAHVLESAHDNLHPHGQQSLHKERVSPNNESKLTGYDRPSHLPYNKHIINEVPYSCT